MKLFKLVIILVLILSVLPQVTHALTVDELLGIPTVPFTDSMGQVLGTSDYNLNAHSMVVLNQVTGETLLSHNASDVWEPASLTKLLTALVVMDTKPNFNKKCTVAKEDDAGGARLAASVDGAYKMKDLFSAMLVGSANNAAKALANQCTGMSTTAFIAKMNEKAKAIGATHSIFTDPSGLDEGNKTTAGDMAIIANNAFSTQTIREFAQQKSVRFSSLNRPFKTHTITSTSKNLFTDPTFNLVAGKTGYLNEFNYASSTKNINGQYLITVVLGNPSQADSFTNTKTIASWGFGKLNATLAAASVH